MNQRRVIVRLSEIRYEGANIGHNTSFAVTVNGETTTVGHDIRRGKVRLLDTQLFMSSVSASEVELSIHVRVTEAKEIVPDVGENQKEYRLQGEALRTRLEPLEVLVQENRGVLGKGATAGFIFEFEVEVFPHAKESVRRMIHSGATSRGLSHFKRP